jgi:ADP-ribose pyrophosphatase
MKYWKQLDRKTIYHSDWLSITLDKIELPDGRIIDDFELMHYTHEAVGIVAVNSQDEILLVRAYRYLHDSVDWEIPGGIVEPGENHTDAARREFLEETGYEAEILSPMLSFFPHKATCSQKYWLYLAQELKCPTPVPSIDKDEITECAFHAPSAVMRMIEDGEINDGMSLLALHRYFLLKHL